MCLFARLAILMILLIDTNMVRVRYFNDMQLRYDAQFPLMFMSVPLRERHVKDAWLCCPVNVWQ